MLEPWQFVVFIVLGAAIGNALSPKRTPTETPQPLPRRPTTADRDTIARAEATLAKVKALHPKR
jgi:hypothetical protein